jgi:hypothetical protein
LGAVVSIAENRFNNGLRYRDAEHPNNTQFTPSYVLDLVREDLGGLICLDPCTTPDNPVGAARFYTVEDDGLSQPWGPRRPEATRSLTDGRRAEPVEGQGEMKSAANECPKYGGAICKDEAGALCECYPGTKSKQDARSAAQIPRRCRWFGHRWGRTEWSGDHWHASGWKERHTHTGVRECYRCGTEETVEWFDSRMAWAEHRRELEDDRLEAVIRRATR